MTVEQRVRLGGVVSTLRLIGLMLIVFATVGQWPPYGPWTVATVVGAFFLFVWARQVRSVAVQAPWPAEENVS